MKKITMMFVTVMMIAGFAASALADSGWSNDRRFDDRGRYDQRIHDRYDHRDYRDHRGPYYRPVIVHRVPVRPPEPIVRVYEPYAPGFSLYFPNFSIQIR